LRIKEQATRLTLHEHDDDDVDEFSYFSCSSHADRLWGSPASTSTGVNDFSSGIKQPELEARRSPSCSTEVMPVPFCYTCAGQA
jgi:hypothetical protein